MTESLDHYFVPSFKPWPHPGSLLLWHSRWKRRRKKIDALLKKNQHCGGSSNAKESRHALEQVSINSDSPGRGQRGRRGPKVSFQWGEVRVLDLLSELILLTSIILFYLSFSFIHFTAFPHGIYIGSLLGTGPAVWWFQAMATVWLIRFFPLDHQKNSLLLCLLGGFGTWCSDEINAHMVQGSYPPCQLQMYFGLHFRPWLSSNTSFPKYLENALICNRCKKLVWLKIMGLGFIWNMCLYHGVVLCVT